MSQVRQAAIQSGEWRHAACCGEHTGEPDEGQPGNSELVALTLMGETDDSESDDKSESDVKCNYFDGMSTRYDDPPTPVAHVARSLTRRTLAHTSCRLTRLSPTQGNGRGVV